ncbi:DNA replication regulator SLD2 [Trichoderma ghanense]|uniref:DNA replication regulator SLD2 n=1 Tax=Trichoderma ghanense TaxID=65468 RepID=A0ABY2HFS6_9HYPO
MDDTSKKEYEAKAQKVRTDLKQWEADWAKTHEGKKPGREDIKNNPVIAQKYKDYNKLRDIIAGKLPPLPDTSTSKQKHEKRKSDAAPAGTPMKRAKHAETPSKRMAPPSGEEYMNSPAVSRKLFSPTPITSIGPTPQRDGKVLGLFDLLVEREFKSPLKGANRPASSVHATPSKRRSSLSDDAAANLGRTPSSASKRKLFSTPMKKRDGQNMAGTPSSVSKLQFDTPAFLKRHSLPTLDENTTFDAPPLRLPRKPLVRGLSEIVASLRKVEEEQLDDDLEALREMEAEAEAASGGPPPQPPVKPQKPEPKQDILEPDSQAKQLPLGGFDDEGMYDSPTEEAVDRDGRPMKIFKKKGQKRTTRRVNMRPVRTKRPANLAEDNESDDFEDGDQDTVPDTQARIDKSDIAGESDGDFEDGDDTPDAEANAKKPVKPEGVVKKAARKVNQLAHANFHRLKLRNHGAKGGPGHNSRFRRRR